MRLIVVGLNHHSAPVEVREKATLSDRQREELFSRLRSSRTIVEGVILSTCNRSEFYAVVTSVRGGVDFISGLFASVMSLDVQRLSDVLYVKQGRSAAAHLFRVAGGLDSMVVGETQILGQVRDAFDAAVAVGCAGSMLSPLFRSAVTLGKRAQSQTRIGQQSLSISHVAVQLIQQVFGTLEQRKAVVVGAGKMSLLSARNLKASGIGDVSVVSRSFQHAQEVADLIGGHAYPWSAIAQILKTADIVISSTGARGFVLGAEEFRAFSDRRMASPLVVVDMAVPRDVNPVVVANGNIFLYDIDDLEGIVAANKQERQRHAEIVELWVQEGVVEFASWLNQQQVVPVLAAVRANGERVHAQVMQSLQHKLPNLTEREVRLVSKHLMSVVNQILRDPIQHMKEQASFGPANAAFYAELFGVPQVPLPTGDLLLLEDDEQEACRPAREMAVVAAEQTEPACRQTLAQVACKPALG